MPVRLLRLFRLEFWVGRTVLLYLKNLHSLGQAVVFYFEPILKSWEEKSSRVTSETKHSTIGSERIGQEC